MKRIIAGKLYNTDTAEKIVAKTNGESSSSFTYYSETLYKTPNGNFFKHIEGGAKTPIAERIEGTLYNAERISLVSEDEARYFAELNNLDIETYEKFFGKVEEA